MRTTSSVSRLVEDFLKPFSNLFIVAVHYTRINTCYVLLLYTIYISTHAMYYCCTLYTYQLMLCIVSIHYTRINSCYVNAIVDCTHIIIGSTTTFFKDLVTLHRRTIQQIL